MGRRIARELAWFFLIVNTASWLLWLPALLRVAGIGLPLPAGLLLRLGDFMPSLVAICLTAKVAGRAGLSGWLKGAISTELGSAWYLYACFLMPVILFAAYLLSHLAAGVKFSSILVPIILPKVWPLLLLLPYFVIMQGPLAEELGWRGYALPRLFELCSPIKSTLILGTIWAVWHLPKFFLSGTTQYGLVEAYGIGIALAGFTLYTILLTAMMTVLFVKTRGSVLAAILFHTMSNFAHGLITILTDSVGGLSILLVMMVVVGALLVQPGRRLGIPAGSAEGSPWKNSMV